jgi:hypothetical protein
MGIKPNTRLRNVIEVLENLEEYEGKFKKTIIPLVKNIKTISKINVGSQSTIISRKITIKTLKIK